MKDFLIFFYYICEGNERGAINKMKISYRRMKNCCSKRGIVYG